MEIEVVATTVISNGDHGGVTIDRKKRKISQFEVSETVMLPSSAGASHTVTARVRPRGEGHGHHAVSCLSVKFDVSD